MKIIIDAGHGPATPGKRSPDGSLREFQFNAEVAVQVKRQLAAAGHVVLFTHQPERDVPLAERVQLANRLKGEVLVSIHANAFGSGFNPVAGIETYTYTKPLAASARLASGIHTRLIAAVKRRDRGVKRANFMLLRETVMPAVLVECGFMTNLEELALLKSSKYRTSCATAVSAALIAYAAGEEPPHCC
ncbi:N-acetylmuramoyl-L-alanine amidase [Planococcus lenghuensis]|uniref:N-acetylmuramoyl-L-alanine amidase n=1 Tax=Planococcus lenghuensis TaxID=2213202 RepID=A0A1Q2KWT0_9BACL|nr:N-acetylmuramoyl-L-alanine amidase [Planococcus lenghuensis]AQQ52650.1 N-acetylmuramoyl-L-alanine amidase [Planococcus lenghuensis]